MAGDTAVGAREPRWAAATFGFVLFLAGSVGTWLCWRYFVDTYEGQLVDDAALRGSVIGQNLLWRAAEPVLDVVSVSFVVLVLSAAALIAVMRRRLLLAIQVTVLVGGANLTTQTLKHTLLERPPLAETGAGTAGLKVWGLRLKTPAMKSVIASPERAMVRLTPLQSASRPRGSSETGIRYHCMT